jgi:hypothetical protein
MWLSTVVTQTGLHNEVDADSSSATSLPLQAGTDCCLLYAAVLSTSGYQTCCRIGSLSPVGGVPGGTLQRTEGTTCVCVSRH